MQERDIALSGLSGELAGALDATLAEAQGRRDIVHETVAGPPAAPGAISRLVGSYHRLVVDGVPGAWAAVGQFARCGPYCAAAGLLGDTLPGVFVAVPVSHRAASVAPSQAYTAPAGTARK